MLTNLGEALIGRSTLVKTMYLVQGFSCYTLMLGCVACKSIGEVVTQLQPKSHIVWVSKYRYPVLTGSIQALFSRQSSYDLDKLNSPSQTRYASSRWSFCSNTDFTEITTSAPMDCAQFSK
jgi:hypothetical protein